MSKKPRWHETLVNTRTNKPQAVSRAKDFAGLTVSEKDGGKRTGSSASKTSVSCGRSSSLSSRGSESRAGGSKSGSFSRPDCAGQKATKQGSDASRSAVRLRSSRSFSSLQASCLTAPPFMRGSHSLSRLDRRSSDLDHAAARLCVRKSQSIEKNIRETSRLSTSAEQLGSGCQSQPSSLPSNSPSASRHQSSKGQKQTRDGVYTLCAMTSGVRRNWVQAVLKNVRPSPVHDTRSSPSGEETETSGQIQNSPEIKPMQAEESLEGENVSTSPFPSPSSSPHSGVPDALYADGYQSDSSASTIVLNGDDDFEEVLEQATVIDLGLEQDEALTEGGMTETVEEKSEDTQTLTQEQQTSQLVKELEQTQRELSRVQQVNKNLLEELQQEKDANSLKLFTSQDATTASCDQTLALQLQRINHNLRLEVESLQRSQEEARETELRRRVDLLAQQAQLLVTGDATALAQIQLEQDRQRFQEQQLDWERCMTSMRSQLKASEDKERETESNLVKLQQELQNQQDLQQEAEQLRKHFQEMSEQLRAYEEAQAEKEARLQKHLMLLQASQERERKSLATSLAQAEQNSLDLQEQLERAEQQLENLSQSETWSRDVEEAKRQLQEELTYTVAAVQQLQEERDQLGSSCQDLQNHLTEAEREMSRLQERLKTEETHYYNLEHSYERVCEELQVALSKVQQREAETQEMREGYECLLDRKEQELNEILLKLEVLGNSLEETEMKLSEVTRDCRCGPSQPVGESKHGDIEEIPCKEGNAKANSLSVSNIFNTNDVHDLHEQERVRSRSLDASHRYIVTAEDEPEKFMSAIQLLETKLFVTEEKLRDLTQRLEEHHGDSGCQDPQLCSQLTRSRANAQRFSLLLHSQAKRAQRYAQDTETRCRMLVGRFQVALNIIQACRERLQSTSVNLVDLENQLVGAVSCLQQGEKDAEKVQHNSRQSSQECEKVLTEERLSGCTADATNTQHESIERCLNRELLVIQKMTSVLESPNTLCLLSAVSKEDDRDVGRSYKSLLCRRLALKAEDKLQLDTGCDFDDPLESLIVRVCAEAELLYAALKIQQQYENTSPKTQHRGGYTVNTNLLNSPARKEANQTTKDPSDKKTANVEKDLVNLDGLISRLQQRATFLHQVCQGPKNGHCNESSVDDLVDMTSPMELEWIQEQIRVTYLSERLHLDYEENIHQWEELQSKMQAVCREQDMQLMERLEALERLREDNSALRGELKKAEQKVMSAEVGNQRLLEDVQKIEEYHKERMEKLEADFQEKIRELQRIHEEEMQYVHGHYTKSEDSKEKRDRSSSLGETGELELQRELSSDTIREAHLKEMENLQATCDQGFTAMEEMHKKLIENLQQQHQQQVAELLKEKEQLLQEETAATMSAIVAMRRAHKQELERSRQSQHIKETGNITQIQMEYEKEIRLLHKELEALSAQHTDKCLENSRLSQELQSERKSVMEYQKENQELKNEKSLLKAKGAEMQLRKQEARSLKEELDIARADKVLEQKKLQDTFQDETNRLDSKDGKFATRSLGRKTSELNRDDSVKSAGHSTFQRKTEKSFFMRQIRGIRSKSLKEGLSIQERMKIFESL